MSATLPPVVGFDLDMTLVASAAGIGATLHAAPADVGGAAAPLPADDRVRPFIGVPLEDTVAALAPELDVAAVTGRYREIYRTHGVPRTTLLPGALEAITAVRAARGRFLVVSAKAEAGVHEVLDHVGLGRGPLAPDVVAGWLFAGAKGERLRAEGAGAYVGDHTGDVEAARVGGAYSVAVATGPVPAGDLARAGADVVLPDLTAFPDWFAGWLAAGRPVTAASAGARSGRAG